ncbi:trypsin-like peptidase domain-containing protein [Streptomyces pharetrae]
MGPERGQVRVLSEDGSLWGAGVLVAPAGAGLHVITCAHVVKAALRLPGDAPPEPAAAAGRLVVDLPGRGWRSRAAPLPDGWSPPPALDGPEPGAARSDSRDFAVLALHGETGRLPAGTGPLPLAGRLPAAGRRVALVGYPRGSPAGLIATAQVTGRGGACPDWVQLDGLRTTGAPVERGFSGAAVWDPADRRVIGLVTAALTDRAAKVAWMLPVEAAAQLWPPLARAVRPPSAAPCAPPSTEDQYQLADALLDVPQIGHDSGRLLRAQLPAPIRRGAPDHPWPRQQLQGLVQACVDRPGGCAALRAAVLALGGETRSVLDAVAVLDRICCAAHPADPAATGSADD